MPYDLYRSLDASVPVVPANLVATGLTGPPYVDGPLPAGVYYYRVVEGTDVGPVSPPISVGGAALPPPPAQAPGTISALLLPGKRPTGPNKNDGNPFATPLGTGAVNVHANLKFAGAASNDRLTTDPVKIGMDNRHPLRPLVNIHQAGGGGSSATPNYTIPSSVRVHVPPNLTSDGKWNSCAALLDQDGRRVWQGQTLYLSAGGNPAWAYTIPAPSKEGLVDLYGTSALGSHGGGRLSAAMGTIRAWEWLDDAVDIQHALLINLYAAKYLRGLSQGETVAFRWPAVVADAYALKAGNARRYGYLGSPPPGMKMGALLRLLPSYDLNKVTHPKARRVAKALKDFGGYVGDDTAWDVHAISVESTVNSDWNGQSAAFHSQLQTVFQNLYLVANNGPNNIGGGGDFIAPVPPALAAP